MIRDFGNGRSLQLLRGDITKVPVDAMANAANSRLAGGGGVDGAIHAAGGPALAQELDIIRAKQGECPAGSAVATTAGNLPAKYVFHAVGPVWHGGREGEPDQLASAYRSCLQLAEERKVEYISFPSISTGVYGYPLDQAAPVAVREVAAHLRAPDVLLKKAVFVLFNDQTFRAYADALRQVVDSGEIPA